MEVLDKVRLYMLDSSVLVLAVYVHIWSIIVG